MRRRVRGQAAVELALGSLVLITVLMFGIWFGEVGWLSLEVQETAKRALWDVTGRQLHDYEAMDDRGKRDEAIAKAASDAKEKMKKRKLVFARSGDSDVKCEADENVVDFTDVDTDAIAGDKKIYTAGGLGGRSGVACTAQGELTLVNFPKSVADDSDGFFKAKHWDARGAAKDGKIKVCALGRARSGECTAHFRMLVDDWGLQGDRESKPCMLERSPTHCENVAYKKLVHQVWEKSFPGLQPTADFATWITGGPAPIDPNLYWFSYSPKQTGWVDKNYPSGEGVNDWHTGTGDKNRQTHYAMAYRDRHDFWLGKPEKWTPRRP